MQDELLDLVNEKDEIIGTVWRSEAHGNPSLIHREVSLVLFNDKGEVLLQQRSLQKQNDPGQWKLTVSGHINAGEDPETAGARELQEELGIRAIPVFYQKEFRPSNGKETRFFWLYYAVIGGRPEPKLDTAEVMAAKWVPVTQLEEFSRTSAYDLKGASHRVILAVAKELGYVKDGA